MTNEAVTDSKLELKLEVKDCRHEWRVIENFYRESDKKNRVYAFYCVYCLDEVKVNINL